MQYYVVKFVGPFAFIKPWTAVRDSQTYSQQFLTPSMIRGIELKLFPELLDLYSPKILRHRLSYTGLSLQRERTQPKGIKIKKKGKLVVGIERPRSIIDRGVLLEPLLYLAFATLEEAEHSAKQHICLARNEDVMLPNADILRLDEPGFDEIPGFELKAVESEEGFLVGYNRFQESAPMYGQIKVFGNPIRKS